MSGVDFRLTAVLMEVERDFAGRQICGMRKLQEDDYAYEIIDGPRPMLALAVADGMGGHDCGDLASRLAVRSFLDQFYAAAGTIGQRMMSGLDSANAEIAKLSRRRGGLIGTTLVGCVVQELRLWWVSVGDSPLYLWRAGEIARLNQDHSMVPVLSDQVEQGMLTAEEAGRDPERNSLRSAVTGGPIEMIDLREEPETLARNDILLAASDGIRTLELRALNSIISSFRRSTARDIAKALLEAVTDRKHPSQDNATVAVIKVP